MAITGLSALNTDTEKVINYMSGKRTAKQIVGEFFGLREEAIYDDNGENIINYINDFKSIKELTKKKVQYNDKLKEIGVTEEMFNGLFPEGLPNPKDFLVKTENKEVKILSDNKIKNGKTNGGKQANIRITRKTKKK